MSEVTKILNRIKGGEKTATDELLPLVYDELRNLAAAKLTNEVNGHSFDATALVHEAYLRLVGINERPSWENRGHFFGAAATAMKRILLNRARDNARLKRGGNRQRVELSNISLALDAPDELLIDLDEAINDLAAQDPLSAEIVNLRFFAGISLKEAATALGLTRRQVDRRWAYARAWLFDRLQQD